MAPSFAPIAIVGRSCLLPGATTPEELWQLVVENRSAISAVPAGRWRVDEEEILCRPDSSSTRDRSWSDRGGYVEGFDGIFDPSNFRVDASSLQGLDPLFLWTLHCARQALRDAGEPDDTSQVDRSRTSAIFGNLSFPSATMNRLSESVWFGDSERPAALNRFSSSGPARLLREALGLGGGAYCLDAACASSLVAIKLACDRLHDGRDDRVLAGAVNCTDDLFIHVGFCALEAMSRSGRSRPFHAQADGLVPAEGAGFVVLERLEDAERDGHSILGVIRGVGLSNDGRASGLLAPSEEGQARAIRRAYEVADLDPSEVSLLECHATGTPRGDAIELRSSAAVFHDAASPREDSGRLPISSLKSNLGHLITSAGVAGLIKVLEAIKHRTLPPTRGCTEPTPLLDDGPFRLITEPEPWHSTGQRVAGLSAFGFGGNNAHVIVSEYVAESRSASRAVAEPREPAADRLAIVGLGAMVAGSHGRSELVRTVASNQNLVSSEGEARLRKIPVVVDGLRFPPTDLRHSLAQQVAMLEVAREAARDAGEVPLGDRTAVIVGIEADAEISRYGARWRMSTRARDQGADQEWAEAAREAAIHGLEAAGVVGTMPNIPANRINSQLDAGGFGFTVSAGEDSGLVALDLASRALRAREIDAAVVGASDLSCEPVHRWAMDQRFESPPPPGDAAVALVVMRLDEAIDAGRHVYAVLSDTAPTGSDRIEIKNDFTRASDDGSSSELSDPCLALGMPFAAAGLLRLAAGVIKIDQQQLLHDRPGDRGGPCLELGSTNSADRTILMNSGRSPKKAQPADNELRRLELPAHPPRIELPPVERTMDSSSLPTRSVVSDMSNDQSASSPSSMPLPPVLPTVESSEKFPNEIPVSSAPSPEPSSAPIPEPTPPAVETTQSTPAPTVQRQAPLPAPEPMVGREDPLVAAYQHQLELLAAGQQEFVARQTATHLEFLAMRQRSLEAFGQGHVGGVEDSVPAIGGATADSFSVDRVAAPVEPMVEQAPVTPVVLPSAEKLEKSVGSVLPWPTDPAPQPAATEPAEAAEKVDPEPTSVGHAPVGPTFDRQQLEVHAGGRISTIFGQQFTPQDEYERQVRMPLPPLLLADRVTGISGEAGSMGVGTIWTETDVDWDSWYLHQGSMPAGIMIETGQADLMLISWLGVDLLNRGERVYRLLGCELTFHGNLPRPGDTLKFEIHLDGHASQGDVRLMFFHYACVDQQGHPRLSVRGGQAGFFTDQELDDSAGILWTPEGQEIVDDPRLAAPLVPVPEVLDRSALEALADGRPWDCFGAAFEAARAHIRTPRIQNGNMLFLDRVTELDPSGGPWQRGYLRAEAPVGPDDWFFDGHFMNDPCMPGTLMFEGCLQSMAVYLAAFGFTLERDGWCFQPVSEEPFLLRCRGQVTPTSRHLMYEVFVEEVIDGPIPTLYADLLCTVDGLKAFHARRVGLQLVPGYPLDSRPQYLAGKQDPSTGERSVARSADGFAFDYRSLLACAWGRPSEAFGPIYERFDGFRNVARLPGPPYHFMSRVIRVEGEMGGMQKGSEVEVEYDVPSDAWYFDENGSRTMPYAVLLEAALQPCGWLASYIGSALTVDDDLSFRNLDGTAAVLAEVLPKSGTLRTVARLVDLSKTAAMIIVSFEVDTLVGETPVHEMKTVFGFFPAAAMADQVGLETTTEHRELLSAPGNVEVDLRMRSGEWFSPDRAQLAEPQLLMLDRVTGLWLDGGNHGRGRIRTEKDVDAGEWFFKAHFFSDPVQPGSLGIEAMIQALQVFMLESGMDRGIENPRFEPLALEQSLTWKYRGQVVTANQLITTTLDIVDRGVEDGVAWARAEGSLWVDGKRIYEATSLGMRIVAGTPDQAEQSPLILDPDVDLWLRDHCPTYTVPALPMMSMVDYLASASSGPGAVIGLRDVRVKGWVVVDRERRLIAEHEGDLVTLSAIDGESGERLEVATARVVRGAYPQAPPPLPPIEGDALPSPYETAALFHGPAFRVVESLIMGTNGSSSVLRAESGVPIGEINPGLLDGATHGIPHDRLDRWDQRLDATKVAYPAWITELDFFGPTPTSGEVRCEARLDGFVGTRDYPAFRLQLIDASGQVWVQMKLVEACFPKGRLGGAPALDRRAFLRDRRAVDGLSLSRRSRAGMRLSKAEVEASDWLPGTVQGVFQTTDVEKILEREFWAAEHALHPGLLPGALPLTSFETEVVAIGDEFEVSGDPRGQLDLGPIRTFWEDWSETRPAPVEDLYYGLIEKFVRRVVVEDPPALDAQVGKNVLYLANHQVGIESLLFSIIASGLNRVPTVTLAKIEHRQSWLGGLIELCQRYPGARFPEVITFFDRENRGSLPQVITDLETSLRERGHSVMVHVEGTRSMTCRHRVELMSGAFIDLALAAEVPIVPVRFVGALPIEPLEQRLSFPHRMGQLDIYFGRPLLPETLAAGHYGERKETVIEAINSLGPPNSEERPLPADQEFEAKVEAWGHRTGVSRQHATLATILATREPVSEPVERLLAAARAAELDGEADEDRWLSELATRLLGA